VARFLAGRLVRRVLSAAACVAVSAIAVLVVPWSSWRPETIEERNGPVVEAAPARPRTADTARPLPGNDSSTGEKTGYLVLTGTHVAVDPGASLAFIGVDPTNPQTYGLHALLVNGTRVHAIAHDHVLLERDRQVVKLEIGGNWQDMPAQVRRLTAIERIVDATSDLPAQSSPPHPSLSDALAISPEYDAGGILTAYRLRPGRLGRVFPRWGLEPGDRLVAIENAALRDVDAAAQMLERVGRGDILHATVLRDGARIPVVLDGGAIAEEKANAESASAHLLALPSG